MMSAAKIILLPILLSVVAAQESSTPMLRTALDILSKASTSSEVLSLNLSSLLILLVLKAIIIGVGFMSGASTARSLSSSLEEADITGGMCFISYTTSDNEDKLSCIARTACESPSTATDYLTAAKLWYKMHKIMKAVPFNKKYNRIIETVRQASVLGAEGGDCSIFHW